MKLIKIFSFLSLAFTGSQAVENPVSAKSLYDIPVKTITGDSTTLRAYEGKVILIVNVASKCGFTPQYEGLQKIYNQYKDQGFVIVGFPSNDFLKQEPGTSEEIVSFCQLNYGVTFPLFEKIVVKNGKEQHPLYHYLTSAATNPKFSGKITWNFNKFLIAKNGEILNRFESKTKPEDPALTTAIQEALAK